MQLSKVSLSSLHQREKQFQMVKWWHLLYSAELSGNQSYKNFIKGKFLADKFIKRTMNNLPSVCHIIKYHPSVVNYQPTGLFHILIKCQCGFLFSDTFWVTEEYINSHVHYCKKTLQYSLADSLWHIFTPLTPQTHKNLVTANCSSLVEVTSATGNRQADNTCSAR